MKQSAVEFLAKSLKDFPHIKHSFRFKELVEQAKEMEKEQIVLGHINGQSEFDNGAYRQEVIGNAEHYYNETFKTKER